ncbi:SHC-transforming protein 1, partial [Ophiophagus hannah]
MPITLTISTNSLNLMASDCKQDTAEYVAYVAKDPVNHRACHILECPEGLSQDVISTIGQAFELRFKQYLKNPPKLVTPHDRDRGPPGRTEFMVDPSYVNVQNLEKLQPGVQNATSNGSVQRDLFDMTTMEEQLRRESWYHGQMSRKESEKLLQANGDFLVRESTTTPGQYVLTGLQGGHPKHLLL